MSVCIHVDREKIAEFCRRHYIRRLAFFGSVLSERFRADSDVDVLVEFTPGSHVGFFDIAGMEQELSEMLGREVDFRTPNDLIPYFRDDVLQQAEVQYAA